MANGKDLFKDAKELFYSSETNLSNLITKAADACVADVYYYSYVNSKAMFYNMEPINLRRLQMVSVYSAMPESCFTQLRLLSELIFFICKMYSIVGVYMYLLISIFWNIILVFW